MPVISNNELPALIQKADRWLAISCRKNEQDKRDAPPPPSREEFTVNLQKANSYCAGINGAYQNALATLTSSSPIASYSEELKQLHQTVQQTANSLGKMTEEIAAPGNNILQTRFEEAHNALSKTYGEKDSQLLSKKQIDELAKVFAVASVLSAWKWSFTASDAIPLAIAGNSKKRLNDFVANFGIQISERLDQSVNAKDAITSLINEINAPPATISIHSATAHKRPKGEGRAA